jgi:hypothetical protein
MLLLMFAGWVNRHQLDVIEYLQEENRVLKERMGGRRLRFTDAERRRLARKAQALGRKVLNELETLVTPDTLLRWYRELVASKWNYSHRRSPGRPRVMRTIVELILQMALENPSWGYTRIRGALANLGHQVGCGTIANILSDNGIKPAPERGAHTRWSTFLKAHWECLTATDFMSVEVNAFAERFVRSIKEEFLSRMIYFGQASLRHAITQFMTHYHDERNHQGLENRLLRPLWAVGEPDARVKRRQRLGGMLSYYHREAA